MRTLLIGILLLIFGCNQVSGADDITFGPKDDPNDTGEKDAGVNDGGE